MRKPSNTTAGIGRGRPKRRTHQVDLTAALERARPAITAACAPAKGLRTARRTQLLREVFGARSPSAS